MTIRVIRTTASTRSPPPNYTFVSWAWRGARRPPMAYRPIPTQRDRSGRPRSMEQYIRAMARYGALINSCAHGLRPTNILSLLYRDTTYLFERYLTAQVSAFGYGSFPAQGLSSLVRSHATHPIETTFPTFPSGGTPNDDGPRTLVGDVRARSGACPTRVPLDRKRASEGDPSSHRPCTGSSLYC